MIDLLRFSMLNSWHSHLSLFTAHFFPISVKKKYGPNFVFIISVTFDSIWLDFDLGFSVGFLWHNNRNAIYSILTFFVCVIFSDYSKILKHLQSFWLSEFKLFDNSCEINYFFDVFSIFRWRICRRIAMFSDGNFRRRIVFNEEFIKLQSIIWNY